MRFAVLAFLASILLAAVPASAQQLMTSYTAYLSERDHFNSNGQRLTSAAAIIRQDRANYHRFNRGDAADEWDSIFGSIDARARMESLLNKGSSSASAIAQIVNGTPFVTVEVWGYGGNIDHINVTVN